MDKRMICLDIDGTLLNSKNELTLKTKEAIFELDKKGHVIVLVSARMPMSINKIIKENLKLTISFIAYNGSVLCFEDLVEKSYLLNKNIDVNVARRVYNNILKEEVNFTLYRDDSWFVNKVDRFIEEEESIVKITPNVVKDFEGLFNIWEKQNTGPNKILCIGKEDSIEILENKLMKNFGDELNIYRSKPTYLEIMERSCSKKNAIKVLQKRLKIKREQVIAIGDNYNDVDMIKYAGCGIAMGNSPKEVKFKADNVTLSNDEDGVAFALSKLI